MNKTKDSGIKDRVKTKVIEAVLSSCHQFESKNLPTKPSITVIAHLNFFDAEGKILLKGLYKLHKDKKISMNYSYKKRLKHNCYFTFEEKNLKEVEHQTKLKIYDKMEIK